MSVIDCHVHLYPAEVNRGPVAWAASHGETHWARLCTRVRKNGTPVQTFPDVAELLSAMDEAGVERAILQGWYWENHDTCCRHNRFYAECLRAHPNRLSAFASLYPSADREVIRDEIRWIAEHGFIGLGELSPHSQGIALDAPVCQEIFLQAAEQRWPVNLHVTEPSGKSYPGRVATPLADFVRLAQEHPSVTIILAHWGARLPLLPEFANELKTLRNVFYDTAASPLLYDAQIFSEMIASAGPERVLFGSDYPVNLYSARGRTGGMEAFLAEVHAANLSAQEERAILSGNARRLFNWAGD